MVRRDGGMVEVAEGPQHWGRYRETEEQVGQVVCRGHGVGQHRWGMYCLCDRGRRVDRHCW